MVATRSVVAVMAFAAIVVLGIMQVAFPIAVMTMLPFNVTEAPQHSETAGGVCPGGTHNYTKQTQNGSFHWSPGMRATALASYFYGHGLMHVVAGLLADVLGGAVVFKSGILLAGLSTLLSPLAATEDAIGFVIMRFLVGASVGAVQPSIHVLFSKWIPPKERQQYCGFVFSAFYMGKLIGMFGCGVIVDGYGWKSVFYATGITAIVLFAPAYFLVYDSPSVHPRISNEERHFIKSAFEELDTNSTTERSNLVDTQSIQRNWGSKCAIIRNVPLWAHIFFMFGGGWLATFIMTELPTFSRNVLHFNIKQAGYISALPYLSGFVCASLCGSVSGWVRRRGLQLRTIYRIFNGIAAIGPVMCLLAITWMGCNASSIIILLVLTMGLRSSIYGGGYLNHLDLFPHNAGFVSAFTDTLFSISGACEPILTNAILQGQHTLSRWHHVFYVGMVIVGLPYIPYFFFVSVKRQTELESSSNKTIKYQPL